MSISLKYITLFTILAYVISKDTHYKEPWLKCMEDEVIATVGNYWWCAKPCETNADCPTDVPETGKNLSVECNLVKEVKYNSKYRKLCTVKCLKESTCPPSRDRCKGRLKTYCKDLKQYVKPLDKVNKYTVTSKKLEMQNRLLN